MVRGRCHLDAGRRRRSTVGVRARGVCTAAVIRVVVTGTMLMISRPITITILLLRPTMRIRVGAMRRGRRGAVACVRGAIECDALKQVRVRLSHGRRHLVVFGWARREGKSSGSGFVKKKITHTQKWVREKWYWKMRVRAMSLCTAH